MAQTHVDPGSGADSGTPPQKDAAVQSVRPLWLALGLLAVSALALLAVWLVGARTPTSWQIVIDVTRLDDKAFIYPSGCQNDPETAGSAIVVDDDPSSHAPYASGTPIVLPPMASSSVIVVRVLNEGGATRFRALLTERRSGRSVIELNPTVIPSLAAGLVYVAAVYADGQPAPLPSSCSLQLTPQTVVFDAKHHIGSWPRFAPSAIRDSTVGKMSVALAALVIMLALATPQARRILLGRDHYRSALQGLAALAFALGLAAALWLANKGVIVAGAVGVAAMATFSWVAHRILEPDVER